MLNFCKMARIFLYIFSRDVFAQQWTSPTIFPEKNIFPKFQQTVSGESECFIRFNGMVEYAEKNVPSINHLTMIWEILICRIYV